MLHHRCVANYLHDHRYIHSSSTLTFTEFEIQYFLAILFSFYLCNQKSLSPFYFEFKNAGETGTGLFESYHMHIKSIIFALV